MMDHETLLDHIDIGVLIQDAESRILYANQAAKGLLGLEDPELLRRSSFDPRWNAIHPDGSPFPGEDHPVPIAIRTGRPVRGVVMGVWRTLSEEWIWLLVNAVPRLDAAGQVAEVVATITNVSEGQVARQELQALNQSLGTAVHARTAELTETVRALKASESNYRAVIRAMAEGVTVHDPEGRITTANPAAQQILGQTLDQMRGKDPLHPQWEMTNADGSLLSPDELPVEITRKTGEPCRDRILRVRRGPGDTCWLSVNTDPIVRDAEDPPHPVVATFTDITAQRQATRAIAAGRDRLHHLTEAVPGLILEHVVRDDGSAEILFASARAAEVLGATPDALLSDPGAFWEQVHPNDRGRLRAARARALEEGSALDEEFRLNRDPAHERWLRLRSAPPTSRDPGEHLFTSILLDVTEERRLARAVYDHQRQEGLGTLAAGIAHNFNNMLAAIVPTLELASETGPEELRPEMTDAYRAALAATDLVRQLLVLAGRDAGPEQESVALAELTGEVLRICQRTFDRKTGLELDLGEPAADPLVLAKRAELQQVILNLAVNARDALRGRDAPRITFRIREEGGTATLEVEDNGQGMSPEVLARIGEPFFTTKPVGEGTGLGLASALRIVRDAGGSLTWDSREGVGTTFRITLPVHEAAETPAPEPAPDSRPDPRPRSGTILVVDDEQLVRKALVRMVRRMGYQAVQAADGHEALELLDAGTPLPALILLDMSMPGMSGTEVLEAIRARHPTLPVILASGYLPELDAQDTATHVLQKPVTSKDLRAALAEALGD